VIRVDRLHDRLTRLIAPAGTPGHLREQLEVRSEARKSAIPRPTSADTTPTSVTRGKSLSLRDHLRAESTSTPVAEPRQQRPKRPFATHESRSRRATRAAGHARFTSASTRSVPTRTAPYMGAAQSGHFVGTASSSGQSVEPASRRSAAARVPRRRRVLTARLATAVLLPATWRAKTVGLPLTAAVSLARPRRGAATIDGARCTLLQPLDSRADKCPLCAAPYMERSGLAPSASKPRLKRAWPAARVARLDRDSVRRKGGVGTLLSSSATGEIDVLVGTQMDREGT